MIAIFGTERQALWKNAFPVLYNRSFCGNWKTWEKADKNPDFCFTKSAFDP
jgi:hypothetical protein